MNQTNYNVALVRSSLLGVALPFVVLLLAAIHIPTNAQEQQIEAFLKEVEANNPSLKAAHYLMQKEMAEESTRNKLEDPKVSYAHLRNNTDAKEKESELVISQEFNFPGLYMKRAKEIKLKQTASELKWQAERQTILLSAKELCLDVIALKKKATLREKRLELSDELLAKYRVMVEKGETGILALRRLEVERLNAMSEAQMIDLDLKAALRNLATLNGGKPIDNLPDAFPQLPPLKELQDLWMEVDEGAAQIKALRMEADAARSSIASAKMQGWPKIEVGYRRNTESRSAFNGFLVGISIPLFSNRNEVKKAKAEANWAELNRDNLIKARENDFLIKYNEALSLNNTLEAYRRLQSIEEALRIRKMALDGGQISLVDYLNEVAALQEAEQNRVEIALRYHKAVANLMAHRL